MLQWNPPRKGVPRRNMRSILLKSFSIFLVLCIILINGSSPLADTPKSEKLDETSKVNYSVSFIEMLQKPGAGLNHRFKDKTQVKKIHDQAKLFVKYKNDKLSSAQKAKFIADCLTDPQLNPFCEYLSYREVVELGEEEAKSSDSDEKTERLSMDEIKKEIENKDFNKLNTQSRGRLYRAIRGYEDWSKLEKLTQEIIEDEDACPGPNVLNALAFKAEDFFPSEVYRKLASRFYERADRCAKKDEVNSEVTLARFRLSLLHLWNKDCQKAGPYLDKLAKDPSGDFVTRALYWTARCAENSGNKMQYQVTSNLLFKHNPIGYHTLLAHHGNLSHVTSQVTSNVPNVLLHTEKNHKLNHLVIAVEALLQLDEKKLARKLIHGQIQEQLDTVESGFKMYVAVLAAQSEIYIYPFQILGRLFREDQLKISPESLRIFFPLKSFSTLRKYGNKIDPYFLSSLIRQESGFNPGARSPAGALGLMQLMPATARHMNRRRISKRQILRPQTNVRLGVRLLENLLDYFDGDVELVLASYNAGKNKVVDWQKRYPVEDRVLFLDLIPYAETRDYVALIARNYFWYTHLYTPKAFPQRDGFGGRALAATTQKKKPLYFQSFIETTKADWLSQNQPSSTTK